MCSSSIPLEPDGVAVTVRSRHKRIGLRHVSEAFVAPRTGAVGGVDRSSIIVTRAPCAVGGFVDLARGG